MKNPLLLLAAAAFAVAQLAPALAQTHSTLAPAYPAKPVRLILSYPPGGATDVLGRMLGRALSETWGVQVVPDNRPGASGAIGTNLCVKSPPDGYTMCMVAPAQATASRLSSNVPFDSLKDFAHVTQVVSMPMLLLVHPALPVRNVRDLLALAKRRPGALNYASSGGGASHHLAMEMLKQQGGVDIVLVTYKGGGAQLADQLAGRVETAFNLAVGVMPHVKSGKLRVIAVSTKQRFPALPEVPSVDESGLKGFDAASWQGLSMPAGVPREIVRRVSADAARFLRTPDAGARLLEMGGVAVGSTAEEFDAFFKAESEKWFQVARKANIRVD
ncbi:MAG: tripartite tricarboxylate transporter substrate binding protein [Burkholderiales bacterium]|nr:tripartite tricarboxylate transporter substrate binding protein [Burkholderiales bacterium]